MVTIDRQELDQWQEDNAEWLRYDYDDLTPSDKCLDIGSYQREWANKIHAMYGCSVECFDALDNRAAWFYDGELQMGGQYYYTSMFEPGPTKYKCVDITPYLKDIAICKINIEGGEYDLMDYILSQGLQKEVRNFQIQFHYIENVDVLSRYLKITSILSRTHVLTYRYPFVWENWKLDEINKRV